MTSLPARAVKQLLLALLLVSSPTLVAHALLVTMSQHKLSADELRVDSLPPGKVGVTAVVARGRASPPGVIIEDISTGAIQVNLVVPTDNRTPAESMGYRIRAVSGTIPTGLNLPLQDVRAISNAKGAPPYLVLYWGDAPQTPPLVVQLTLSIAAVDLAGNVGEETRVEVRDPAAPSSSSTCASGQHRCPDGSCKPNSQACAAKPTCRVTCSTGRCCDTDKNGCCTKCVGKGKECP